MRYPVDVYTGKIQAYPEGKPSAKAKNGISVCTALLKNSRNSG
ncbi:hypothetical protein QU862_27815, partial [Escherichia coli]|nr:hypothetical protein [Escherichia coli]